MGLAYLNLFPEKDDRFQPFVKGEMMRYIFILFMLITMTHMANSDQSSGSIYHLNSNEILDLKNKAETDPKASYGLYEYYTLSEYNEEESLTWLEKAALLGHELAQFNYVKHFYDNGNKKKANSLAKKWKDNVEINKLFLEKNPSNKK